MDKMKPILNKIKFFWGKTKPKVILFLKKIAIILVKILNFLKKWIKIGFNKSIKYLKKIREWVKVFFNQKVKKIAKKILPISKKFLVKTGALIYSKIKIFIVTIFQKSKKVARNLILFSKNKIPLFIKFTKKIFLKIKSIIKKVFSILKVFCSTFIQWFIQKAKKLSFKKKLFFIFKSIRKSLLRIARVMKRLFFCLLIKSKVGFKNLFLGLKKSFKFLKKYIGFFFKGMFKAIIRVAKKIKFIVPQFTKKSVSFILRVFSKMNIVFIAFFKKSITFCNKTVKHIQKLGVIFVRSTKSVWCFLKKTVKNFIIITYKILKNIFYLFKKSLAKLKLLSRKIIKLNLSFFKTIAISLKKWCKAFKIFSIYLSKAFFNTGKKFYKGGYFVISLIGKSFIKTVKITANILLKLKRITISFLKLISVYAKNIICKSSYYIVIIAKAVSKPIIYIFKISKEITKKVKKSNRLLTSFKSVVFLWPGKIMAKRIRNFYFCAKILKVIFRKIFSLYLLLVSGMKLGIIFVNFCKKKVLKLILNTKKMLLFFFRKKWFIIFFTKKSFLWVKRLFSLSFYLRKQAIHLEKKEQKIRKFYFIQFSLPKINQMISLLKYLTKLIHWKLAFKIFWKNIKIIFNLYALFKWLFTWPIRYILKWEKRIERVGNLKIKSARKMNTKSENYNDKINNKINKVLSLKVRFLSKLFSTNWLKKGYQLSIFLVISLTLYSFNLATMGTSSLKNKIVSNVVVANHKTNFNDENLIVKISNKKLKSSFIQLYNNDVNVTAENQSYFNFHNISLVNQKLKEMQVLNDQKMIITDNNIDNSNPIYIEGLALVVHAENPIKNISYKNVQNIFEQKISNWIKINGISKKIHIMIDQQSIFNYKNRFKVASIHEINSSLRQKNNTLAVVSLKNLNPSMKVLMIDYTYPSKTEILRNRYVLGKALRIQNGSNSSKKLSGHTSLIAGGDVIWDRGVHRKIKEHGYQYIIKDLANLFKYGDISVVNLENPISERGDRHNLDKGIFFKAKPKYISILTEMGVNLVSMANNHTFDYGLTAAIDTTKILKKNKIRYVGFGLDTHEALMGTTYNIHNKKIRVVGYNTVPPLNVKAKENWPGISIVDRNTLKKEIQKAKNKMDYLIILIHSGSEYNYYPNEWKVKLFRKMIDYGADIILGSHPHVVQSMEMYKGKPIIYSLGNLIFDQYRFPVTRDEMVVELNFYNGKLNYVFPHFFKVNKEFKPVAVHHHHKEIILSRINRLKRNSFVKSNYSAGE